MINTYVPQTKAIYKGRVILKVTAGFVIVPTSRYKLKTIYRTLSDATDALDRWHH